MPVSYRIDPAQKAVYTTFEGDVTDEQFVQHARKIESDPEIDGSFVELMHVNTSSMDGVTTSGIDDISDILKASTAIKKIGIITSRDVEYGLARMVELLAHQSLIEIQAFRERSDAESWLGIE